MITITSIENLQKLIDKRIEKFAGKWSYLIEKRYHNGHEIIARKEDYVHKSASMIKVLILATLCASDVDFNEKMRVDAVPRVEGGGALQEINGDAKLTIKSLASLMIVLSDNLATNLLIKRLGMGEIQRYADKLGLKNTKIQRCMMDFSAASEGRENYLTVSDYNKLLWHIYAKRDLPRFKIAWDILGRQQFRDRIPYYWGEDVIFHHKTGMLDHVEHDGGIYEAQDGAVYSIIIFASELPLNCVGGRQMSSLGWLIFKNLKRADNIYEDKIID